MANISLQISSQTAQNISALTNNLGNAVLNQINIINNVETAFNTDFNNFFFISGYGSYYFPSPTQGVINTNSSTYTLNGGNLQAQVNAAIANHSGSANISSATLYNKLNGNTITESGNVVLTGTTTSWYISGNLSSETLTTPSTYSVLAGNSQTAALTGNITYVNGLATAATVTSDTLTTNGYVSSQVVGGNITIIKNNGILSLGGTVSSTSQNFANGDYINVTNLNVPANGSFSLSALPNGGNVLTGTYSGISTVNGGTGNDTIAAGNGQTTINGGGGVDTVTFKSALNKYTITPLLNGTYSVSSTVTGEGPDTLTGITYLQFSDATVSLVAGGTSVTNPTGQQTTLVAPTSSTTVTGGGYDVLNFSSKASSVVTLTANGDGSLTVGAAGVSDHVSGVMQITLADKTITIANSDNANVARLYQAAFGRSPDAGGLAAWENVYSQISSTTKAASTVAALAGTPVSGSSSIADLFVASQEFQNLYGTNLSHSAFVNQVYQNVLHRAPDPGGAAAWTAVMDNGSYTQGMVLVGIAESGENISGTTFSSSHATGWLFGV